MTSSSFVLTNYYHFLSFIDNRHLYGGVCLFIIISYVLTFSDKILKISLQINDSDVKLEIDSYLYRSYIALQRYTIVRNELKANCHPYLEPLKLLVDYYLAQDKNVIVQKMDDILSKDVKTSSNLLFITAAIIYYHELNYESALQILHQGDNLEW